MLMTAERTPEMEDEEAAFCRLASLAEVDWELGTTWTQDVEVRVVIPPFSMVAVKVFFTALEVVLVPVVMVFSLVESDVVDEA